MKSADRTPMRVLAIDLGASNGRGIVGEFDGNKIVLEPVHYFPNKMISIKDSFYWDILRLYDETVLAIQKALNLPGAPIASVALDGWAQDFGLLDDKGNLLGCVHTYRDPYSAGMVERFLESMTAESFYNHTGVEPLEMMTLFQLMGLREKELVVYENAHTLLFIPDLIKYFLTGEKSCNISFASLSGLFDIQKLDWSDQILDHASLKPFLPPIIKTREKIGEICVSDNKKRVQLLSIAAHDTMSAMSYVPCNDKYPFFISSGTWSAAGHRIMYPELRLDAMRMGLLNELGFAEGVFLIKNLTGLWIEQELLWQWGESISSIDDLRQAAEKSDYNYVFDTQKPTFHIPGRMEQKIMDVLNESGHPLPENKPALYRCVMHSLACKYQSTINDFETLNARTFKEINIVGGGSKNKLLNQFTADACKKQVIAGPAEATTVGNIISQLMVLGEIKDFGQARDVIDFSFKSETYSPGN